MFKPIQSAVAGIGRPQPSLNDASIKRVFMVLHGFYGNLFLTKFATGLVEDGEDQGIANARRVWAHSLREYDAETIKTAMSRCRERHPEFPPSLPQFSQMCEACKPRKVYRPEPLPPALEMSQELREQRRAEARAKATEAAQRVIDEMAPTGLAALMQSIASAAADAGADEAAVLWRLEREMVTPRRSQR
jgi:hypothetical protein